MADVLPQFGLAYSPIIMGITPAHRARCPQEKSVPLAQSHAQCAQGSQRQTEHRPLPRLRTTQTCPPRVQKLLRQHHLTTQTGL